MIHHISIDASGIYRHQVFVEPEGEFTNEMYIGGMSSSLPEDVQYAMYRSVPFVSFVTRSSINTPIYPSERSKTTGSFPCNFLAALIPAINPCAAASSYPELPFICPALNNPSTSLNSKDGFNSRALIQSYSIAFTEIGYEIGLIEEERYQHFCKKRELIEKEVARLSETMVGANKGVQTFLEENSLFIQFLKMLHLRTLTPDISVIF